MNHLAWAFLLLEAAVPMRCEDRDGALHPREPSKETSRAPHTNDEGPIRIETLDTAAPTPTFVMRGGPRGPGRIVFLHGMCSHALGYAQSFQWSAARKGTLIAPQGDVPCDEGPFASWSQDIEGLDARIEAAYRALGEVGFVDDIALVGYSQGASRAEALARRSPDRYTRLV